MMIDEKIMMKTSWKVCACKIGINQCPYLKEKIGNKKKFTN
jgi:hypothetical protein